MRCLAVGVAAAFALMPFACGAEQPPEAFLLGLRLMDEGLYSEAAQRFEKVYVDEPDSAFAARAKFLSAECKYSSGWDAAAQETYTELSKGRGREALLSRLRLAEYALEQDDAAEALNHLQSVSALSGRQEGYRLYLEARALAGVGRVEEAERTLTRMAGATEAGGTASLLLGWISETRGNIAEAQSHYRSVVQGEHGTGPYAAIALVHLADIERRAGRFGEALGLVSRARRAGASLPPTEEFLADYVEGASLLGQNEEPQKASRILARARNSLKRLPEKASREIEKDLALVEGAAALASADADALRSAIKTLPEDTDHYRWLTSWLAYLAGDFTNAVKLATSGLRNMKDRALAEDLRAVQAAAALETGNWLLAFSASASSFPGRPRELSWVIHAASALKLGRREEVMESLRKIQKEASGGRFTGWAKVAELIQSAVEEKDVSPERLKAILADQDVEPYRPALKRLLVRSAYAEGDPDTVEATVKELLPHAQEGEKGRLRRLLAWARYVRGDKVKAAETLLEADTGAEGKYQAGLLLAEAGDQQRARSLLVAAGTEGARLDPDAALYAVETGQIASDVVFSLLEPLLAHEQRSLREKALRRLFAAAWDRDDWDLLVRGSELVLKKTPEDALASLARLYKAFAMLKKGDARSAFVAAENALPGLGGSDRILGVYVRGVAGLRTGKEEQSLTDLLYVGMLSSGRDDLAEALRRHAVETAAEAARKQGRTELARLAAKYLEAPAHESGKGGRE